MAKQRSLADLYVRGKEVRIESGDDYAVVWIQKMNPVEHAQALRKASAARAKVLSAKFDKEGDEYQSILSEVLNFQKDGLVEILVASEEARIAASREAKVADLEQWKADDYLNGLRDLWVDEMAERFIEDPDDAEAKRIHDELERFTQAVRDEIDHELDSFRVSLGQMTEKELIDSSMENRLRINADLAWVNEYHRMEVALGTRKQEDHREKVFENRVAVDELQFETYRNLATAFAELNVDPLEGKDSAVVPPSSDSSEPSAQEETPQPSGPPAAAA